MSMEAKWKANQDRAAFLKTFPGLLRSWEQTVGQTVESANSLSSGKGLSVLIFSNASFALAPPVSLEPRAIKAGLTSERQLLESRHPQAFAEFDRLSHLDQQAGRQARLENILGAIRNNLEDIPELKSHIRSLVQTWDS